MVNDLIDGISIKLHELDSNATIYDEDIQQGHKEPCFFILSLMPMNTNKQGLRAYREYPFDIHYFPVGGRREMQRMAEQLFLGLEFIRLVDGSLLRATRMRYEIVDGVLHFFVNYNFYIKKPSEPQTAMETLKTVQKG